MNLTTIRYFEPIMEISLNEYGAPIPHNIANYTHAQLDVELMGPFLPIPSQVQAAIASRLRTFKILRIRRFYAKHLPAGRVLKSDRAGVQRRPGDQRLIFRLLERSQGVRSERYNAGGPPYSASPTSGRPIAARCARIWCVRPVRGRASSRA